MARFDEELAAHIESMNAPAQLDEFPEDQVQRAQDDATAALLKIRGMEKRIETLEQNLQILTNVVRNLSGHRLAYLE